MGSFMKLLICTPAYAGQVTSQYLQSMLMTSHGLIADQISFSLHNLETESLIPRARNTCAAYALDHGFTRLFFIDADMIWKYEDFKRILDSDSPIIGGTYPTKGFPIQINYNPVEENEFFHSDRTEKNFKAFRAAYANEKGEAEVLHIPTGFMCIKTSVFMDLVDRELVRSYGYRTGTNEIVESRYDFFPSGVHNGNYLSEDWGFCELARAAGYKIMLNTKTVLGHTGVTHYRMSED